MQPGGGQVLIDAGLGDHAPVADQNDLSDPEPVAHLAHLARQGHRIRGVAGKHLDGHRAALGRAEHAVDHLWPVAAVVAGIAQLRQFAGRAFEVAGGDVEHHQPAFGEMAPGELAFDGGLAPTEPVHAVVELVHGGALDTEQGGEGCAAFRAQFPLQAQLGAGAQQAADDQGQRQAALAAGTVKQDPVEFAGLRHAQDGAGGAVGAAGPDRGGSVAGVEDGAALQGLAQGIDGVFG